MICAVIDSNNQLVNLIVADINDPAPDGCTLVEIHNGYYWDGQQVRQLPMEEDNGN